MGEKFQKRVEAFKRDELELLLEKCTDPQREKFKRIFPNGVPEDKLYSAIELCERTITKNVGGGW